MKSIITIIFVIFFTISCLGKADKVNNVIASPDPEKNEQTEAEPAIETVAKPMPESTIDPTIEYTAEPAIETVAEPMSELVAELSSHPGKQLYAKHCLPCHQADGSGVPGMFPPLDKEWVDGDNETLISIVVYGMDEEIEVNGERYSLMMAPLPHLSDQEVKDVLNYVRMEFGSSDNEISTAEVREVRNSGSGKKGYQ